MNWWNKSIISQNLVGLDSVKERDMESKADKNQIKACILKREERQNPHILLWWFIALFSFSQPILCHAQRYTKGVYTDSDGDIMDNRGMDNDKILMWYGMFCSLERKTLQCYESSYKILFY